jgi:hypothetical protein
MAAKQQAKKRRTPIKIAAQSSTYAAGKGATAVFETLKAKVGSNPDGTPVYTDIFYCEWLNFFGTQAIAMQQDNVLMPGRIRMTFVQSVYDALTTKAVRIYKYGREDAAHTFILTAAADNYLEQNQMLEFNVKRYEDK